jgi:hypothetical protein
MKKRSFLGALAMIAMLAVITVASPGRALAQSVPNNCCGFIITVSHLIPAACLPISVKSSWGGVTRTDLATVNGDNPITFVPCPPIPATFDWVSLDGGVTKVPFGGSATVTLPPPCGLTLTYDVSADAPGGCIHIRIHP